MRDEGVGSLIWHLPPPWKNKRKKVAGQFLPICCWYFLAHCVHLTNRARSSFDFVVFLFLRCVLYIGSSWFPLRDIFFLSVLYQCWFFFFQSSPLMSLVVFFCCTSGDLFFSERTKKIGWKVILPAGHPAKTYFFCSEVFTGRRT